MVHYDPFYQSPLVQLSCLHGVPVQWSTIRLFMLGKNCDLNSAHSRAWRFLPGKLLSGMEPGRHGSMNLSDCKTGTESRYVKPFSEFSFPFLSFRWFAKGTQRCSSTFRSSRRTFFWARRHIEISVAEGSTGNESGVF